MPGRSRFTALEAGKKDPLNQVFTGLNPVRPTINSKSGQMTSSQLALWVTLLNSNSYDFPLFRQPMSCNWDPLKNPSEYVRFSPQRN